MSLQTVEEDAPSLETNIRALSLDAASFLSKLKQFYQVLYSSLNIYDLKLL